MKTELEIKRMEQGKIEIKWLLKNKMKKTKDATISELNFLIKRLISDKGWKELIIKVARK